MRQLREHLGVIHDHFEGLCDPAPGEPFAMEIEFKITSEDILAIKQARPWVFGSGSVEPPPPPTPPPPTPTPQPPAQSRQIVSGDGGGGGGGAGSSTAVAPKFSVGPRTERIIADNARLGDAVGNPVAATHPLRWVMTYSLSGSDAAFFTVDEHTGQIRVKEGASLTEGGTFTFSLTARDSSGVTTSVTVAISVIEATHHWYDLNRDGTIDRDEVVAATNDYYDGLITKDEVIDLIKMYFAGYG